jgi:hypothetical protein
MVYVRMRSPNSKLNMTPYQAITGIVPDISNVRTIGATAYVWNKSAGRRKMVDPKSKPCKLLGFKGSSIYQLLTSSGTVIEANNVVFEEERSHIAEPRTSALPQPPVEVRSKRSGLHQEPVAKRPRTQSEIRGTSSILSIEDVTNESDTEPQDDDNVVPPSPTQISNVPLRVSTRSTKGVRPAPFGSMLLTAFLANIVETFEPATLQQAQGDIMWPQWEQCMKDEIASLIFNNTWQLVDRPTQTKVLRGRWVFKNKRGVGGAVVRHKARWVVRGFEQREGLDYHETFASVIKPMSYKALFAIAAALALHIEQMDVKTAFLYGKVDETIYVEQPTRIDEHSGKVCKLNRALYGLKQAPRVWYNTLREFLLTLKFSPLSADPGVFSRGQVYIAVYVDDLLIIGPSMPEIEAIKLELSGRFEMSDLGPCAYYLGIAVVRDLANRSLRLSQRTYTEQVLRQFGMWGANPADLPMATNTRLVPEPDSYEAVAEDKQWYSSAVGSLMYLMLCTRPDIAYSVSVLSRFLVNPGPSHLSAVKHVLRYFRGTLNYDLVFRGSLQNLTGYTDSDWAGDTDTRRSTAGYIFNLGSGAISWSSKLQPTVALSSTEAEYMGQTQATKEAVWLRALLNELDKQNTALEPVTTVRIPI